jgi:hypothetical protein
VDLKLITVLISLAWIGCSTTSTKPDSSDGLPISVRSATDISATPVGRPIRFEAVIVDRPGNKCIDVFLPDEFEKYEGDGKWAIQSRLQPQLSGFGHPEGMSRGIVTGEYAFVRDIQDGPCGIVTGHIFEISNIEYK